MASDPKEIFETLVEAQEQHPDVAGSSKDLDKLVQEIFDQAAKHRNRLVWFYILYTSIFSLFVLSLIALQAWVRWKNSPHIELIPAWALNLILVGMFGQFIGLLTIVTTKVWEFKSFLDHAKQHVRSAKPPSK
jgi:hypothetical protein